jgi:NAD(P)-dependent dehydrogenase (short-subunit alcohol dehydrogenase family)
MRNRVLVTGASRGTGRDMALGFASLGATVIVSARQQEALEAVAAEVDAAGGRGIAVVCDVTEPEQVERMRSVIMEQIGGVDILINNAGAGASHKFLTHPHELWHEMLAINLTSVYYVTRALAGPMVEQQWGRIINIASTAAKVGGKYVAAYTAAKHGVLGLTRALAVELGPHVTVNAICPGFLNTPMTGATIANIVEKSGMTEEEARAAITRDSVQQRLIEPAEVTALALFLARESSSGITGQAINVDGGAMMW